MSPIPIASGTRRRQKHSHPRACYSPQSPISLRHSSSDLSHYQSHYQSHDICTFCNTLRLPPLLSPHPLPTQEGRIADHLIPVHPTKKPARNNANTVKIHFFRRTPKPLSSITGFCQTQSVRSYKLRKSALYEQPCRCFSCQSKCIASCQAYRR